MAEALLVRFRPAGPWRLGPANGARTRTDRVLHSDSLYSAVTSSMMSLGWGGEWLAATAEAAEPTIRLSSCFPYTGKTLLIPPPRTAWPPASGRVRWKAARLVPLRLIPALLRGDAPKEEHWAVEPVSECVLPVVRNVPAQPPFRVLMRKSVPVDRLNGVSEHADVAACLQFAPDAGMWFTAAFGNDDARAVWSKRMEAAARLLADTGIGGGRSRGWGRSHAPEFESVDLPAFFTGQSDEGADHPAWWLVSLFLPSDRDEVLWDRGNYGFEVRSGRIESHEAWGDVKPRSRMVAEGSVLLSSGRPSGAARNVAELSHPVYRSGIALTVPVPWREPVLWPVAPVEEQAPAPQPVEAVPAGETAGEPEAGPIIAPGEEQTSPVPVPETEAAPIEAETEAISAEADALFDSLLSEPEDVEEIAAESPVVSPEEIQPQPLVPEEENTAADGEPEQPFVPPPEPEEPPVEEPGAPEPPVKEPDPGPEDPDAPIREPGS